MLYFKKYVFILIICMSFTHCINITRISSSTNIDLSGDWNDTDARLVAEALAKDILQHHWLTDYKNTHQQQKPVIIVGDIYNKTHEHIAAEIFIKHIEKAVINAQAFRIVANGIFREKLQQEKKNIAGYVSVDTQQKVGQTLGANFMLLGSIHSIVDMKKKKKVIFYQVDLELIHLDTNEKVWIGEKKIKKYQQ